MGSNLVCQAFLKNPQQLCWDPIFSSGRHTLIDYITCTTWLYIHAQSPLSSSPAIPEGNAAGDTIFSAGLAENRCLERRPQGAQLLQVGEQDLALGAKFRATVILDIQVSWPSLILD